MEAWLKDVIQPLLIAIFATAVSSGSLFVCGFLSKLLMEWWYRNAHRPALRDGNSSPDADSGEQSLPEAEALRDIEMGPLNGGEAANLPHSSSPDDDNAAEE